MKVRLSRLLRAWNRKDQDERLFWITVGCWVALFISVVVFT